MWQAPSTQTAEIVVDVAQRRLSPLTYCGWIDTLNPNSKITSPADAAIAAVRQQVYALLARTLECPSPALLRERASGALVAAFSQPA